MSEIEAMLAEPWRFDFFTVMRRLERSYGGRPRIGDSAVMAEDYVRLGQNPYMDFPASNLERVDILPEPPLPDGSQPEFPRADGGLPDRGLRILVKFLGLLGPQGALPLATTEESFGWLVTQDDEAFPRFLDLINHRFLQLFFRAWSDVRPIAQADRPHDDRFKTYIGAMIGIGTPALQDLDSVPDAGKLGFAGLAAPQVKSASRLSALLRGIFGVAVEIEEFVGMRLVLEPEDQMRLGARNSGLGADMILGAGCFSVEDKIRIRIYVRTMAHYIRFLPSGDRCEPLHDLVFFFVGESLDWDVELALPTSEVLPSRIGTFGQLGWTSWIAPSWASTDAYRCDARFHPADQLRQKRQAAQAATRPAAAAAEKPDR